MQMPQRSLDSMAKADLLRLVQQADFSMHDLGLYLDTHPTDGEALSQFRACAECRRAACDAYAERFGALNRDQVNESDGWAAWSNTPWPWEKEAN